MFNPVQSIPNPLDGHPVYERVGTLGKGATTFSQVARNKNTGELLAIKFIPRGWDETQTKYLVRELLNLQELSLSNHPHVVELKEVFLTQYYLAQAVEYVEGETLQGFLEKVGGKVIEGLARFVFQQLALAVDFCHRKGKINRDIKLSNILLSIAEGQLPLLKLCDFGFSKDTFRNSAAHSQVGTALFTAPEVMQNFADGPYDGMAADIWACGVVLAIMLFGRHPFLRPADASLNQSQQMIKLFQRIMVNESEFPIEVLQNTSASCMDLLKRMLQVNPANRISMRDILRHPWFLEALPPGAANMNDLFVADNSTVLSAEVSGQIHALVRRGSVAEKVPPQYEWSQMRQEMMQSQSQPQQSPHQTMSAPAGPQPTYSDHNPAQMYAGNSFVAQHQSMHQMPNLEDMVMSMPSSTLLDAAIVDLRTQPAAPILLGPSGTGTWNQQQEQQQQQQMSHPAHSSGTSMVTQVSGAAGGEVTQSHSNPVHLDADASHFACYEDDDIPLANISSFSNSIDWNAFNENFSTGAVDLRQDGRSTKWKEQWTYAGVNLGPNSNLGDMQ
eukprot:gene16247-22422_t